MHKENLSKTQCENQLKDEDRGEYSPSFCTLGMFIIDEIEYLDGRQAQSLIGGAGTYAALGARLIAGTVNAHRVSWIVDMGSDFPQEMVTTIDSWGTNCRYRYDASRLTTRAWNGYGPNEYRAFKYLTPKLRLDEHSLSDSELKSAAFHMVCSAERCKSLLSGIRARRTDLQVMVKPVFVWEPVPDRCTPEQFDELCEAAALVDVISPNADEFAALFTAESAKMSQDMKVVKLLERIVSVQPIAVLVREGADGSTLYTNDGKVHLAAYHKDGGAVVDPTGAGNTYLGALTMAMSNAASAEILDISNHTRLLVSNNAGGLLQTLILPVAQATVAASFAVEQLGMPIPSAGGHWNGQTFEERLESYLSRESENIEAWIETTLGRS